MSKVLKADSANGNDVLREMFDLWPTLLTSEVMVIGNAPSAIQSAGQFRAVAREIDPTFDANGTQLYVWSDTFPVARDGDSPADGQNPISGLGSLARAALFLCKAALD